MVAFFWDLCAELPSHRALVDGVSGKNPTPAYLFPFSITSKILCVDSTQPLLTIYTYVSHLCNYLYKNKIKVREKTRVERR